MSYLRFAVIAAGLITVAAIIWFLGPLFAFAGYTPLEGVLARIASIATISVLICVIGVLRWRTRRKRKAALLQSVVDDESDQSNATSASAEEVQTLKTGLEQALITAKKVHGGAPAHYLYESPWYLIIGPPGSGKSTLLKSSSLSFSGSENLIQQGGIGGTRHCDWWFSDQAVLLDTAGRYTTQDSNQEIDQTGWQGFLQLLKSKRPERPINGVFLVISASDLIFADDTELDDLARKARDRIFELEQCLETVMPLYLIINKSDLLEGFEEYFSDLESLEREQIWGFTLPWHEHLSGREAVARCTEEMRVLASRLEEESLAKIQSEQNTQRRAKIYTFPQQFRVFEQRIASFLDSAFRNSKTNEYARLRGIYLTSATQTGSPIDQLQNRISQQFGISPSGSDLTGTQGRAYFIDDFLTQLVFSETGLVEANAKTQIYKSRRRLVGHAALLLLILGGSSYLFLSRQANDLYLDEVKRDLDSAIIESDILAINSAEILSTLPLLNELRAAASTEQYIGTDSFLLVSSPLSQVDKVETATDVKYRLILEEALLPRLMNRLEGQMLISDKNPEQLYELLRIYLMVAYPEHLNRDEVVNWFRFDVNTNFPSSVSPDDKTALVEHIATLFATEQRTSNHEANADLVSQAREIVGQVSLEERIYRRIRRNYPAIGSFFDPIEASGHKATNLFFSSNAERDPLGVETFFTVEAYQSYFLDALESYSTSFESEQWVLDSKTTNSAGAATEETKSAVLNLYTKDYIRTWDEYLSSIQLKEPEGLLNTLSIVETLADPDSPMIALLSTVASNLSLSRTSHLDTEETGDAEAIEGAAKRLQGVFASANQLIETATVDSKDRPEMAVERHFRTLFDLVPVTSESESTASANLKKLTQRFSSLYQTLEPLTLLGAEYLTPAQHTQIQLQLRRLESSSDGHPPVIQSVVGNLSQSILDGFGDGLCSGLNAAWKADVLSFYEKTLKNRYPLKKTAIYDATTQDFSHFFGPGGLIDTFIRTNLASYVELTNGTYTWIDRPTQPKCVSTGFLQQLSKAQEIRDIFFSGSNPSPSITMQIQTTYSSEQLVNPKVDLGNSVLPGTAGSNLMITWPNSGSVKVALTATEPQTGGVYAQNADGLWALLKFFDMGNIRKTGTDPTRHRADYALGGHRFQIEVVAQSKENPFSSNALESYRCPTNLR